MEISRVDENVHLVTGTNVNWALVVEGDAVTLVDAGYRTTRRRCSPRSTRSVVARRTCTQSS